MVAQAEVHIYYSKVCGLCTEAIDFLHKRGITFTAYAIEYDAAKDEFVDSDYTQEMYRRCGGPVEFVPQIFIGGHHIGGWRKMEPLIQSGEIDTLLPEGG
ncbi:glutaredoxin domain-containing protein [Pontiellaceae bacterium B12227]|nr:glutaredoxin domain-containing protein [Pontiellaceae bacterium B12227]